MKFGVENFPFAVGDIEAVLRVVYLPDRLHINVMVNDISTVQAPLTYETIRQAELDLKCHPLEVVDTPTAIPTTTVTKTLGNARVRVQEGDEQSDELTASQLKRVEQLIQASGELDSIALKALLRGYKDSKAALGIFISNKPYST